MPFGISSRPTALRWVITQPHPDLRLKGTFSSKELPPTAYITQAHTYYFDAASDFGLLELSSYTYTAHKGERID
jgi:hypothetical protein